MRTLLLLLCFIGFLPCYTQIQDLAELAHGDFLDFRAIYDRDAALFGYLATYSASRIDKKTQELECFILDKNLNPVSNVTFQGESTVAGYSAYFNYRNELVLYPIPTPMNGYKRSKKFIFPRSRKLNLENKEISDYIHTCLKEDELVDCPPNKSVKENRKEVQNDLKKQGFIDRYKLDVRDDGSVIANAWNEHYKRDNTLSYIDRDRIMRFNKDRELEWSYLLQEENKKKDYAFSRLLSVDESFIYFMVTRKKKSKVIQILLKGIDVKTGQEVLSEDITKVDGHFSTKSGLPDAVRSFDERVIATGLRNNGFGEQIGYYQFIIDKKRQKVNWRNFSFTELKGDLKKINQNGKVEKGFYLRLRQIYTFENGASAILTEKYKFNTGYFGSRTPKTRDFVMILFDENFDKTEVHLIEKDKSTHSFSDLLFSQYLNDKKDYVFFYQDYRKDDETRNKNWVLGINTIIDGKYKNEEIPMSSEDFFLAPYAAKEGYILLREFNKNAQHNQVRLERLNF